MKEKLSQEEEERERKKGYNICGRLLPRETAE